MADELARRLASAPLPDAVAAEQRARRVVAAAVASGGAGQRSRMPRAPLGATARRMAVAAVAVVAAGGLTGPAVAGWVERLVRGEPAARPVLDALPAPGRLLVTGPGGAWTVREDGSRRRLGGYGDATWSPRGRFVAAVRDRTLYAVEPGGTVRWALARSAPVHDPRWSPSGYRIAYRSGGAVRVVAGDGTGDRPLVAGASPVPVAWRPGTEHVLALVRRGGVEVWDADAGLRLRRIPAAEVVAVGWSGRRPVFIGRGPLGVRAAAVSPDGRRAALIHGTTVSLAALRSGSRRVLWSARAPPSSVAWAPDGRTLAVTVPATDQLVLLPTRRAGRVAAYDGVARQFGGSPAVAGWVP